MQDAVNNIGNQFGVDTGLNANGAPTVSLNLGGNGLSERLVLQESRQQRQVKFVSMGLICTRMRKMEKKAVFKVLNFLTSDAKVFLGHMTHLLSSAHVYVV